MNAYMAYDRKAGAEEGAMLVFANTSKEARRILHYSLISGVWA